MAADKRYGLVLSLGGAPNTPHIVNGLPGYFRSDVPRPVGDEFDISLEQAREVSTVQTIESVEDPLGPAPKVTEVELDPPVSLVEFPAGKLDEYVRQAARDLDAGAQALLVEQRRASEEANATKARQKDEAEALAAAGKNDKKGAK